ncbi:MAG TPA: hypothetical protein VF069_20520 [Streptosporangiaceae bacterium]
MRKSIPLVSTIAMTALFALAAPATAATPAAPATPATATGHGAVVSFRLAPPNTAVSPDGGTMAAPGDWIKVGGGGSFEPATGSVRAGGTFTHYSADGTVHCAGTWRATQVTGWTDFGRGGGSAALRVTHYCSTMGEVHTDIPMTVTSTRNAPPGSSYVAGTTVGEFTVPTGGKVTITISR